MVRSKPRPTEALGLLTKRDPSSKLKQSSTTTSSSLPSISEIFPAIHLEVVNCQSMNLFEDLSAHQLLHHFDIHLLHVYLLVELRRKSSLLQQLCIDAHCHGWEKSCCCDRCLIGRYDARRLEGTYPCGNTENFVGLSTLCPIRMYQISLTWRRRVHKKDIRFNEGCSFL